MCCTSSVSYFVTVKRQLKGIHNDASLWSYTTAVEEILGFIDALITAAPTILLLGACILASPRKLLSEHWNVQYHLMVKVEHSCQLGMQGGSPGHPGRRRWCTLSSAPLRLSYQALCRLLCLPLSLPHLMSKVPGTQQEQQCMEMCWAHLCWCIAPASSAQHQVFLNHYISVYKCVWG